MAKIIDDGNRTIFKLEDPAGYAAFKAGLTDRRQWARHGETQELAKFMGETGKHNVIVQYGDSNVKIK